MYCLILFFRMYLLVLECILLVVFENKNEIYERMKFDFKTLTSSDLLLNRGCHSSPRFLIAIYLDLFFWFDISSTSYNTASLLLKLER